MYQPTKKNVSLENQRVTIQNYADTKLQKKSTKFDLSQITGKTQNTYHAPTQAIKTTNRTMVKVEKFRS
nr:MAG TPA: hypothetical protein [Caudoviricetes sp.]